MNRLLKIILLVFLLFAPFTLLLAQDVGANGYKEFYHPNGIKASEGMLREGKPDGYWRNYNDKGFIVSEGNRKNFLLDSLWKFYDDSSKLLLEINYTLGKKNGWRTTYQSNETIREYFEEDVKEGFTEILFKNDQLRMEIPFRDGLEDGLAKEYDSTGRLITVITYRKGYEIRRERINRLDRLGKRFGPWKFFYANGRLQMEGTYTNDLKNGFFKYYDEDGLFLKIEKYENGVLKVDAPETARLELVKEYYPNGTLKSVYALKENEPQGMRRDYNEDGSLKTARVFQDGLVLEEGSLAENGNKEGPWIFYYPNGTIRAKGNYFNGLKHKLWNYYYPNGQLEQKGSYNKKEKPDGEWLWYYPNGTLLRSESYWNGDPEGEMIEYSDSGTIVVQGSFRNGLEEGPWVYNYSSYTEKGAYESGRKEGEWIARYYDGDLLFKGKFISGQAHGWHQWYWPNGRKKKEGKFEYGLKNGNWTSYDEQGLPVLSITFDKGIEKKYNGVKIKPAFEPSDN